jgi:NTE family protein
MANEAKRQTQAEPKLINLALQGGGSHGAFAWGVLDRILEDERIVIEGIVGTSAGAMNAAVTAFGLNAKLQLQLDARDARDQFCQSSG